MFSYSKSKLLLFFMQVRANTLVVFIIGCTTKRAGRQWHLAGPVMVQAGMHQEATCESLDLE